MFISPKLIAPSVDPVGATLLTLGYEIFMGWAASNPNAAPAQAEREEESAS